jgi:hypothetical protein
MPSNTSKGNHGHPDAGSKGRGNQKATYGSGVSPEVAEARMEADDATDDRDTETAQDG